MTSPAGEGDRCNSKREQDLRNQPVRMNADKSSGAREFGDGKPECLPEFWPGLHSRAQAEAPARGGGRAVGLCGGYRTDTPLRPERSPEMRRRFSGRNLRDYGFGEHVDILRSDNQRRSRHQLCRVSAIAGDCVATRQRPDLDVPVKLDPPLLAAPYGLPIGVDTQINADRNIEGRHHSTVSANRDAMRPRVRARAQIVRAGETQLMANDGDRPMSMRLRVGDKHQCDHCGNSNDDDDDRCAVVQRCLLRSKSHDRLVRSR